MSGENDNNFEEQDFRYLQEKYSSYVKERDALRDDSKEISGRYDKSVLTISGGALALSVAFIEKIAPDPISWTLVFLALSWVLLILSLLLELFALRLSQTATNEQITLLDCEYIQNSPLTDDAICFLETTARSTGDQRQLVERIKQRTRNCNSVSIWALTAGIIFLCAFSFFNIPTKSPDPNMSENSQNKPAPQNKVQPINESRGSYVPPANVQPPPKPQQPPPAPAPKPKDTK